MRQEIVRLQRSLNQERIKVRSLTEDAKTPTGVHRWRILKGEDPNKMHLLEKVQMLQRLLIASCCIIGLITFIYNCYYRRNLRQEIEKTNLEQKLEESHKVCESLRRVIENFPTTGVKQRLVETQV